MKYLIFGIIASITMLVSSCKCGEKQQAAQQAVAQQALQAGEAVVPERVPQAEVQPVAFIPKATAFKMNGDYADRVAVTIGSNGNLLYYPAPTDLTDSSCPVEIGDGWWLNRQGLSANSVFTKWTFSEYRALKNAPTPAEIKAAIIPDARVTEFRSLPISINDARSAAPASLLQYLQ